MFRRLFLLTILASAPAAGQPRDQGGQPDWIEQAKIVAQMEGVSVGEAVRRANLERRMAKQAERLEGTPGYAGSVIERDGKQFKIVHLFSDGRSAVDTGDAELDKNSEVRNVRFSMKQLKEYAKSISSSLAAIDPNAYTSFSAKDNKLYVTTNAIEAVKTALSVTGTIPEFVEFKTGGFFVSTEASVTGGGPINGTRGSCTAGFNVEGAVTGVATANHCIPYNLSTHRGLPIGTNRGGAYIADSVVAAGRDFTWYRNDSNTYNNAVGYQGGFYSITTIASATPPVNSVACLIKQNDTQQCAYIADVIYPSGGNVSVAILDRYISVPGDSGGPWLYGSVAYGIHQGKTCEDAALTVNCRSLFSPAANMPQYLGVRVRTQ